MASSSGGQAPRRSLSWSWRGRSRRNSLSESPKPVPTASPAPAPAPIQPSATWPVSPPAPAILRPSRHSVPTVESRAGSLTLRRDEAAALSTSPSLRDAYVGGSQVGDTDETAEAKNNRKSSSTSSRPPPSFYNRPYSHKRHSSATAAPQRSPYMSYDEDHLRPPPSRFRNPGFVAPVANPMANAVPFYPVMVVPVGPGMPMTMYQQTDQDLAMRTQRASEKVQQVTAAQPYHKGASYMYTPMISIIPTAHPNSLPPMMQHPTLHIRPRSSSASSVSSAASSARWTQASSGSSLRAPSPSSSRTSIESMPPCSPGCRRSLTSSSYYQMQGYQWNRPAPIKYNRRRAEPGELFSALPGEVLELILQELRQLHLRAGSESCATCWMRDCCSVALSSRKFLKYAREALYQHVHLVGPDTPAMKKRMKLNYGARMVLLRRTLRANLHIAVIVRSLKPPAIPLGAGATEYNDLVASVIMACPNLERLVGYYPTYDHSFQRVFQALSTRKRLKEMNWIVDAAPALRPGTGTMIHRQQKSRPSSSHRNWAFGGQQPQPQLHSQQSQGFLEFHLNWQHLTTLVVHCQPGAMSLADGLLNRALRRLPSIQNLHLSQLPLLSFNDAGLFSLPPLKKLTLSRLPGVTTAGLSTFATRTTSSGLISLTLDHMNLETLPTIARLFSNLKSLTTFNIVQAYAPILPADEMICLFPYLASGSLRRLHWDIPYLPTRATTADSILAKSIKAGGFPGLRMLRAPNDPEGIFQALCRPLERVEQLGDRYRGHQHSHSQVQSVSGRPPSSWSYSMHARSASSGAPASHGASPNNPLFPPDALMMPRENSDLRQARIAAQARLERARRFPRFFIDVIDERGMVLEKYGVGAFMGTIGSSIHYVLTPDAGGTDEGGGLVSVRDMVGDCGEGLVPGKPEGEKSMRASKKERSGDRPVSRDGEAKTKEGCIGIWNAHAGEVVDKKEKDKWWHVERGRWTGVVPS